MNQALRKREETEDIYRRNIDAVYRVCMLFFKGSRADAEDAAQSTFLKLMKSPVRFENAAHEKSWLIVVASNICRDSLRSGWKTRVQLDEESLQGIPAEESSGRPAAAGNGASRQMQDGGIYGTITRAIPLGR